jgi:hypothetical protein
VYLSISAGKNQAAFASNGSSRPQYGNTPCMWAHDSRRRRHCQECRLLPHANGLALAFPCGCRLLFLEQMLFEAKGAVVSIVIMEQPSSGSPESRLKRAGSKEERE